MAATTKLQHLTALLYSPPPFSNLKTKLNKERFVWKGKEEPRNVGSPVPELETMGYLEKNVTTEHFCKLNQANHSKNFNNLPFEKNNGNTCKSVCLNKLTCSIDVQVREISIV